jgi:hypothetical protein
MAKPKSTAEPSILSRVRLRPLLPEERPRFDQLLQEPHYLTGGRLHLRPQRQSQRAKRAGLASQDDGGGGHPTPEERNLERATKERSPDKLKT